MTNANESKRVSGFYVEKFNNNEQADEFMKNLRKKTHSDYFIGQDREDWPNHSEGYNVHVTYWYELAK